MRRVLLPLVTVALAAPLAAQQPPPVPMPESYRETQLRMLGLQRRVLLSMVDSMPEALYRDKVTPVQRDFAQQIHHAASAVAGLRPRTPAGSSAGPTRTKSLRRTARRDSAWPAATKAASAAGACAMIASASPRLPSSKACPDPTHTGRSG